MDKKEKKVLVPVDFHEASLNALKWGAEFARLHGSELVLIHVVEPVSPVYEFLVDSDLTDKKHEAALHHLDKLAEHYKGLGVEVSKVIAKGKPYKEIERNAKEMLVEMIVIGRNGEEMEERGLLGSNLNKIIRSVHVPVVTVQENANQPAFSKVLIPVDPEFGIKELRAFLEAYSTVYNPTVEICAVAPKKEGQREEFETHLERQVKTLKNQGIQDVTFKIIENGLVSRQLLDYADEAGFDMIWMETHGRKGLSSLIMGSVTEEVLAYSNIPVMSLNPEREPSHNYYYHENLPI